MNRHEKRLLEKKLGEDFPLAEFTALLGYYNKTMSLSTTDFMLYLLKRYIPILYDEKRIYFDDWDETATEGDSDE